MLFATPWYLLGALGAAIPVLLHLYGRRRARRVLFPSLMLLKAAQRERTSLVRLRQVWLMLLRALAILLLSLGLAHPTVPWLRTAANPEELQVLVLDDSLSMRTRAGQQRFETARKAASNILSGLSSRQSAALALTSHPERVQYGNPRSLLTTLATLQPSWQAIDMPHVLTTLRPPGSGRRQVYLLTDLQASNWGSTARITTKDPVAVVDCGQQLSNHAATALLVSEPPVLAGRPVQLAAEVRQKGGTRACEVRVRLDEGALPPQTVAASGQTQALFDWQPEKPGQVRASATVPPDALREDDVVWQAIEVRQQLRVALLGSPEQARWVRLALAPDAAARVAVTDGLPSAQTDAAVAWELSQLTALRKFATGGGGLLLFGLDLTAAQVDGLLGPGQLHLGPVRALTTPTHLAAFDVFSTPLRAFANPAAGDLQEPGFRRYRELRVPPQSALQVLGHFADGTPALLRGPLGRGRVVFANFGTGSDDGDLPRQPVFVPLLHRLVGALARREWPELEELSAGSEVVVQPLAGRETPTCRGPEGQALPVRVDPRGWRLLPEQPGVYRLQWQEPGNRQASRLFAVNTDPLESDPTRLSAEALRRSLQPATVAIVPPENAAELIRRTPLALATPLLVLAFLLLLAETWLTLAGRTRRDGEGHEHS